MGCHAAGVPDPAQKFESIRSDYRHGNLDFARQKADRARNDFAVTNPEWSMRFRLLEAEILSYQGRRPEVLALLNSPAITYPAKGDLAISRNMLCGFAHARLGQAALADQELQEARSLADASHSELQGQLLRTEAGVQVYRGHLAESAELFQKSLKLARVQRDSFLEAIDLINLGFVALNMQHYEEALAWLHDGASTAGPIQARLVLEAALGNAGLAYLELGDYEKALANFQQAEQAAKFIGTTSAQVDWLVDAGLSYYHLGKLAEARAYYEQSLKAAHTLGSPAEIEEVETRLAFLFYEEDEFDAAKTHCDEALRVAQSSGDKTGELEPLYLQALIAAKTGNDLQEEQMLVQVHKRSADNPALRADIENALANLYAGKHQAAQADRWYRRSISTFESRRETIKDEELKLPFFANGDALYRDYANFLIASQQQELALQLLDISRAKTLAEGLGLADTRSEKKVDMQGVAHALKGCILFFALGPQKSWLWEVNPHRTRLFELPAQAVIEKQVEAYQKAIPKIE